MNARLLSYALVGLAGLSPVQPSSCCEAGDGLSTDSDDPSTTDLTSAPGSTSTSTSTSTSAGDGGCGNGVIDIGEQCDDGPDNSDEALCTSECQVATCGDGHVFKSDSDRDPPGEQCDDGGASPQCDADCTYPVCGDGVLNELADEWCDDGNNDDGDGCSSVCFKEGVCGDGLLHPSEECDDGNTEDGDGCDATCNNEHDCGNGLLDDDEGCDDGPGNSDDGACTTECQLAACGDGHVHLDIEACDDGNLEPDDGCSPLCQLEGAGRGAIVQLALGLAHTCVLTDSGEVRCWGACPQIGSPSVVEFLGDEPDEMPPGVVVLGGPAELLTAGYDYTCAALANAELRCWGMSKFGQLGYGDTETVGDDELPASAGAVELGAPPVALSAGGAHTCALRDDASVNCWGRGVNGQLGYGLELDIGDDETPASVGVLPLGEPAVTQLAAGGSHTCALLQGGAARCWGQNGSGQLGYGDTEARGDEPGELPTPMLNLGSGPIVQLAAGGSHTCALFSIGRVRCWGENSDGQLGYENTADVGDEPGEMPPADVALSGSATQIAAGASFSCALLQSGAVQCWGRNDQGQLGVGSLSEIGDQPGEMPPALIELGGPAVMIAAGFAHACALRQDGALLCWGDANAGQLGSGAPGDVGDEPGEMPPAPVVVF